MRRVRRKPPPRRDPWLWRLAMVLVIVVLVGALTVSALSSFEVPPRELAPHLRHRAAGHSKLLVDVVDRVADTLVALDRGAVRSAPPLRLRLGAQPIGPQPASVGRRLVRVDAVPGLLQALADARPGDVIELAPGTYAFVADDRLVADRAGTADARIVVRADRPGSVVLSLPMTEGFRVSAPYWTFENLTVRGTCARHADCEHAFHVVGGAHHTVLRNNTLRDFNAHIKVNGEQRHFPDDGLVDGNTLSNGAPRETASPVTPFDLVAASGWTVRGNLFADFMKAQGDRISYAAFAKGGGANNRFEGNVVLCEWRLRDVPGWRVGLSLGGGGSGPEVERCRDRACVVEQEGGVIESNLIAGCSDDGIYVNRGATSRIVHNTLIDTGGIVVRFAESSAEVEGNLVDGTIRSRDGAVVHAADNRADDMAAGYVGWHPQRSIFRDALGLDLAWTASPPRRPPASAGGSPDLCGARRSAQPAYGAFEDFAPCLQAGPSISLP